MISKLFIGIGSANTFLAVLLGAFGAHALKTKLSAEMMTIYQTGNQYHIYHALGLILVGIIAHWHPGSVYLQWSGWTLFLGILLFAGSLYLLSITGINTFGAITPFGGVAFLIGWLLLIVAVVKNFD